MTLPAVEFIERFLQHVLPRGCTKVRYDGIWSNSCGQQLKRAGALLSAPPSTAPDPLPPRAALPELVAALPELASPRQPRPAVRIAGSGS